MLRFDSGKLSTQRLEVEGPDLRLFAEGSIDLRQKPNALDAEIALFLFRQLDWALVKIPIVSQLLLGENKNLVAAYFQLVGSWQEPVAKRAAAAHGEGHRRWRHPRGHSARDDRGHEGDRRAAAAVGVGQRARDARPRRAAPPAGS